jgi:dihydroxyacetone kinase
LLIIKNYSGDMMNFKNASELAKEDGIEVDYVRVDDDIAVQDSLYTVGKRGVAGTIFVHKIAGALAETGAELAEVKRVANKVIDNVVTLGFALTSCTVPANGEPTFHLEPNEMEYGVGIHGEPGIRTQSIKPAKELADDLVTALLEQLEVKVGEVAVNVGAAPARAADDDETALLINGFGASPLMELYVLNKFVVEALRARGVKIKRIFVGNYMTSLDMAGASVSLLKLDNELLTLLDAKADTPSFKLFSAVDVADDANAVTAGAVNGGAGAALGAARAAYTLEESSKSNKITAEQGALTEGNVEFLVDALAECAIKNEVAFNELDSHAGDGDFGSSIAKGFRAVKDDWAHVSAATTISDFLDRVSMILMEQSGGASGPIWGGAFRAASKSVAEKDTLTPALFARLLEDAATGIRVVGERSFGRGAGIGDKTLMDSLIPAANIWTKLTSEGETNWQTLFEAGAGAAEAGAEYTKTIVARMGRAGTAGERSLGFSDAGAFGLSVLFRNIANQI